MRLIFVELSCLQEKIANVHVEIDPNDLKICVRSMSPICKLNQDTLRTHPWYKFGPNATNICWVIVSTSENCKFSRWNWPPWPRKFVFAQCHPSANLTKTLLETHPWYKFGPNATNICWVIVSISENCKFSCWNRPPWPRKIGQGHPSSNLTKTLLRKHIHGISLSPMRLICVELSCLQEKIAHFHVEIDPHDLEICVRSMSSICKLNQYTPRIHPWYKFGPNANNICRVIVLTS